MGEQAVGELVEPLRAAVDQLLDADLTALSSTGLSELVRALETQWRRAAAVDQRVLNEVDRRGVAGEYARTSTADLLVTTLRVSPGEARARVARARDLQPTRTLTGQVVEPVLPRCAAAVAEGAISSAHVSVVAAALDRIPAAIAYEAAPVAEQLLVEAAQHQHPGALGRTAALLLARLDPDGREPAETERRRGFTMTRRRDGGARVTGDWTPEVTAIWQAILDALAAPLPAADGGRDDRTPAQRRHDAMAEAGLRLLRSGSLPAAGGVPVTVLVRTTAAELARDGGVAQTATGDVWTTRQLRAHLGDVAFVPVVIDHAGAVLACGRTRRLASTAQRLALAVRDGGCCFPGCDRPAAWTQVHHVREWEDGGGTDIDNLCLLCRFHHREFARCGWEVRMTDGRPEWVPPAFLDAERKPVRNTVHHLPDLDFDVGRAS